MKKILIKGTTIAVLGALSITMTACGSNPQSTENTPKTESSAVIRESGSRQKETQAIENKTGGNQSEKKQTSGNQRNKIKSNKRQTNKMQSGSEESGMSESKESGQAETQTEGGTENTQNNELAK
ncbi:hypothetical protein [Robinsoniella sp. KNHs210]|uniref:hypothetical protein n=1 Tax=Robinsoniella sp. KNHs210 TaxID=1469950 RepID=UPI000484CF4C|nr:hypothetical protein [Robinsoniella sp. KNHs210]